jgi:hypothetical protein
VIPRPEQPRGATRAKSFLWRWQGRSGLTPGRPFLRFGSRSFALGGVSPVIGNLLVIQVADARDKRGVAFAFGPGDCLTLGLERAQLFVALFLDDVIVDMATFGTALLSQC